MQESWLGSHLVESLPSMYETLGSIHSASLTRHGVVPALRRWRQGDKKIKAVFYYTASVGYRRPHIERMGKLRVSGEGSFV